MKFRKIAAIVIIGIFVATFFLYGYYPVTVTKNLPVTKEQVILNNSLRSRPVYFSNVTIPKNVISVEIDVSMNSSYVYGGAADPSYIMIGLFTVNNSTNGLQRAGFYQPSRGYYEILITHMSYSMKEPFFNPNGSLNTSKFVYDNYTFLGKSYRIGIDPSLSYESTQSTINWVKIIYKYKRF